MNKRRPRSRKERGRLFALHNGICHLCGGKIVVGQAWDLEHVIPLEICGDDSDDNLRLVHRKCHAIKTQRDLKDIAKAKRRQDKHTGVNRGRGFRKPTRVNDDGTPEEWTGFRWREMR